MALRLIQVRLPGEAGVPLPDREELEESYGVEDAWREETAGGTHLYVLTDAERVEGLLDDLEARYGDTPGFRVVLLPVEATLPRPALEEEDEDRDEVGVREADEAGDEEPAGVGRVSREELYARLSDAAELDAVYVALTALSAVVCALGLMADETAVVIGAMVIAPILAPLVAVALATTLGDDELGRRGGRVAAAGLVVAVGVAFLTGLVVPVDPDVPALAVRTQPGLPDLVLAVAAGSAGTLAFTTGLAEAVIGVMVAVALVPPAVATGLLAGGGYWEAAGGSLLLTATNLVGINLAGVATFLARGVRPGSWWEAERARRATWRALVLWGILVVALVGLLVWGVGRGGVPS